MLLAGVSTNPSALADKRPPRELLFRLMDQARELTGAHYVALGVLDDDQTGLLDLVHLGVSLEEAKEVVKIRCQGRLLTGLLEGRRAMRISNLQEDPRAVFPPGHPVLHSFLGVPLIVDGKANGFLYLCDKNGHEEFSAEDERLMQVFGAQAALSLAYARKAAEVEAQRGLLDAVFQHVAHGIIFFAAPDGRMMLANQMALDLVGQPLGDEVHEEQAERYGLFRPDGRPFPPDDLPTGRAFRGETVVGEEVIIARPDGRSIPILVSAAPVRHGEELLGVVAAFQDITAQRSLEQMREEFIGLVAHDLRNPITAMMVDAERLLNRARENKPPPSIPTLERMVKSTRKLKRMVSDLLDVTRIDVRHLELDRQSLDISEVVAGIVNQLRESVGPHAIEEHHHGNPGRVLADPMRIDQIVTNLIDNAAKYSPDGAPIVVAVAEAAGGVEISVRDQGAGIDPEDIPRLFDRFYQTTRARRMHRGLGLGLYITRGLVDAHDGRIEVESVLGKGSTFRVWLPSGPSSPAPEA